MGQVVPLYLPVDDEPQFPRIPLVDDGPALRIHHPHGRKQGERSSQSDTMDQLTLRYEEER